MPESVISPFARALSEARVEMGIQSIDLWEVKDPRTGEAPLRIYWHPLTVEEQAVILVLGDRKGVGGVRVKVWVLQRKAMALDITDGGAESFIPMFTPEDVPYLLDKAWQGAITRVTNAMMDDEKGSDAEALEAAEGN